MDQVLTKDIASNAVVRPADIADQPLICAHRQAMFADAWARDPERLAAMGDAFAAWLASVMARGHYLHWLVEAEGRVVAGAGLWLTHGPPHPLDVTGERGYILNVWCEPALRGRGLARRAVEAALQACAARELSVVTMHATRDAQAMAQHLGFMPTSEMWLIRGRSGRR